MKDYLKTSFLVFISMVVFVFILFIDAIFYHVPAFIKIYRYEREIGIVIAFLCLYPIVKKVFRKFDLSLKQNLFFLCGGIVFMILLLFLPQLVLKNYLILWDNNPFLAEFPVVWSIVSTVCAISIVIVLILLLFNIRELILYKQTRYSGLSFKVLVFSILAVAVALNFWENRYTFQPTKTFYTDLNLNSWAIVIVLGGLFIYNSYRKSWIDVLNKNEKITAFIIGLIILPLCIYIYLSRLIFPIYAYSITVKGFAISSLGFIIVYTTFSFIGILVRLPIAAFYDRVIKEVASLSKVSQMINSKHNIDQVIDSILQYMLESTNSDVCWLELVENERKSVKVTSAVNLPDSISENINLNANSGLTGLIISSKNPIIIDDVFRDDRTIYMKLLKMPWKSILAVPLIKENTVNAILYAGKKGNYAFGQSDLNTLKTFLLHINILLESKGFIQCSIESEKTKWELNFVNKIGQKLYPGKIPELKDYQIEVVKFRNKEHIKTHWDFINGSFGYLGIINASINKNYIEDAFCLSELKGIINILFRIEKSPSRILKETFGVFIEMSYKNILMNLSIGILDVNSGIMSIAGIGNYLIVHYDSISKEVRFFEIKVKNSGIDNVTIPEEVNINIKQSDIVLLINSSVDKFNKYNIHQIFIKKNYTSINGLKKYLLDNENKVFKNDLVQSNIMMVILKRK
ncbi:MAG: GAF domain-containing protein [Candidatus Marinimicrobia bacterium]|nr:GAF domain-containing protein [Candidatus Neomarinimicrobiota bacterium]